VRKRHIEDRQYMTIPPGKTSAYNENLTLEKGPGKV